MGVLVGGSVGNAIVALAVGSGKVAVGARGVSRLKQPERKKANIQTNQAAHGRLGHVRFWMPNTTAEL